MSKAPDPILLCRYEELAQREDRLREARVSAQATAAEQLPGADDLEGQTSMYRTDSPVERARRRAPE